VGHLIPMPWRFCGMLLLAPGRFQSSHLHPLTIYTAYSLRIMAKTTHLPMKCYCPSQTVRFGIDLR